MIKRAIHVYSTMILKVQAPNYRALKYVKQKTERTKRRNNKSAIMKDSVPLIATERSTTQKTSEDIKGL